MTLLPHDLHVAVWAHVTHSIQAHETQAKLGKSENISHTFLVCAKKVGCFLLARCGSVEGLALHMQIIDHGTAT